MNNRFAYALCLVLTCFSAAVVAQEITFTAAVDRNAAAAGEAIRYTVTLTNAPRGSSITPPDLNGLVVVQGPFDNSSFQSINGRMSSSVARTWLLTATRPGDLTIGAATARVGGGTLQTTPITLKFTKAEGSTPSNALLEQGQKSDANLFCTISLSKNKVYVGEQVIATYTLYSRYNSLQPGDYDLPKLNGFWAEEIDLGETSWERTPQTVNGLRYNVAILKKQVLIPQRSGKLRIEPMELTYRVNPTFFSSGTPVTIKSNTAEVNVTELPAGKPEDFIGAVGELRLEQSDLPASVKANEAVDLSLRFTGRANLKLIDAPQLRLPPDFEAYDPKIVDKVSVNGGGMSGSREFQYLLIPRSEGEQDLEPITFSYFDPGTGRYERLTTGPLRLTVTPGDPNAPAVSRPRQSDVQQVGNDIRYIRTGDLGLEPVRGHLFGSWPYVAGMGAPVLGLFLLLGWQRRRDRARADLTGMRRKGADRVARQRLKAAEAALHGNDREGFHTALGKALEGYFADRFDLGVAEVNGAMIQAKLGHIDDGKVAQAYAALLTESQLARYAPLENKPRQQVYEEAVALIRRIEAAPRA
jgi:hypothetical protein